jgi:hypothetical protein|tara:strand:+ start:156 stop:512 length:357 start_codon:yes stop_codon:yes gene_type:complete
MIVKQKCRIIKINATEEKGAKNFKVRKVVFAWKENNNEQYLTVDVLGDNTDMFVNYNEQEDVDLSFAIGGRKWDSPEGEKYFNQTTFIGLERIITDNQKEITASIDAQFPPEENDLPF